MSHILSEYSHMNKRNSGNIFMQMNAMRIEQRWCDLEEALCFYGFRINDLGTLYDGNIALCNETIKRSISILALACVLKCTNDKGVLTFHDATTRNVELACTMILCFKSKFHAQKRMARMVLSACYENKMWDDFVRVFLDVLCTFSLDMISADFDFPALPRGIWLKILYELKKRGTRMSIPDKFDKYGLFGSWRKVRVSSSGLVPYVFSEYDMNCLLGMLDGNDSVCYERYNEGKLYPDGFGKKHFTIIVDGTSIISSIYKYPYHVLTQICKKLLDISHVPLIIMDKEHAEYIRHDSEDKDVAAILKYVVQTKKEQNACKESILASIGTKCMLVSMYTNKMKKCFSLYNNSPAMKRIVDEWISMFVVVPKYVARAELYSVELVYPKTIQTKISSHFPTKRLPFFYVTCIQDNPEYFACI